MKRNRLSLALLGLLSVLVLLTCAKKTPTTKSNLLPASTLLEKIPAQAIGVVVARAPYSLWDTFTTKLPLPMNAEEIRALEAELTPYWHRELGFDPLRATTAVGFAIAEPLSGAVLIGPVPGTLKETQVLVASADIVMAKHGDILVVGMRPAVELAIASMQGQGATLKESKAALYGKILQHKAPLVIAVDVPAVSAIAPLPPQVQEGLHYGFVTARTDAFSLSVTGEARALQSLQELIEGGLALGRLQFPGYWEEAWNSTAGFAQKIAVVVVVKHLVDDWMEQAQPKIVGDTLRVEIDMKLQDRTPPRRDPKVLASSLKYAPANTIGISAMQSDVGLWEWVSAKSWLTEAQHTALKAEILAEVEKMVGLKIGTLHGGVLFLSSDEPGQVQTLGVYHGFGGIEQFRVVDAKGGENGEDIVAITRDNRLFWGTQANIEDALLGRNSLQQANPEFYADIVSMQDHSVVQCIDVGRLPPSESLPILAKLNTWKLQYGKGRMRTSLNGEPEALQELLTLYSEKLSAAQDYVTSEKEQTVGTGPWLLGAGFIFSDHLFRGAAHHLRPVLQGGTLSLELSDAALNIDVWGLTVASYAISAGMGAYYFVAGQPETKEAPVGGVGYGIEPREADPSEVQSH